MGEGKEVYSAIADILIDMQVRHSHWVDRIFSHLQEVILKNSTKDMLEFLCTYAERAEVPSEEREDTLHNNGLAGEAIHAYVLAKKIAEKVDPQMIKKIDEKIFNIGERANPTRESHDKKANLSMYTMLYAYENIGLDTEIIELETIEKLDFESKPRLFEDIHEIIATLCCRQKPANAQRIANKLNERYAALGEKSDLWDQGKMLLGIVNTIAHNKPELYEAMAPHLAKEISGRIKYEGTDLFCGESVLFKSPRARETILSIMPDTFDCLRLELENPEGIEGSTNKVEDGIPSNLGLKSTERYDKSRTAQFVERDGVYNQYLLIANSKEEIERIKKELLPRLLKKGYSITYLDAGRKDRDTSSDREIWRRDTWITGARLCPKKSLIQLATTEGTEAAEVKAFVKELEIV